MLDTKIAMMDTPVSSITASLKTVRIYHSFKIQLLDRGTSTGVSWNYGNDQPRTNDPRIQ